MSRDRRQTIRIVWVIGLVPQGEGRAVIENEEADDEPCPAVGTTAFLTQHDLGPDPPRDRASLRAEEWPPSLHRAALQGCAVGRSCGGGRLGFEMAASRSGSAPSSFALSKNECQGVASHDR